MGADEGDAGRDDGVHRCSPPKDPSRQSRDVERRWGAAGRAALVRAGLARANPLPRGYVTPCIHFLIRGDSNSSSTPIAADTRPIVQNTPA